MSFTREQQTAITNQFKSKPIDEWMDFIKRNAKNEEDKRIYKNCARKALSVANMKEYIERHDNTTDAKHEFKKNTFNGEKQSILFASKFFINKYLPELKIEPKTKACAFDAIKDW